MDVLTYNVKLSCPPDCDAYLMSQLLMARDCYNEVSKVIFEKRLSYRHVEVHNVTYYNMRAKFPQLNSDTIQQVTKTVCANYKAYKTRHKKYPSKALVQKELSFQLAKGNYSNLTKSGINLSCRKNKRKKCSFVSYSKLNEMFDKYEPTSPKLGFRNGHYYLSIPFKFKPIKPKDNSCLGVDLGCRRVVTTSDGIAYSDKEQMALRRKIRFQKRQLRQVKDKKHSHSASKKLRKVSYKERNQNKDFCHRVANAVLETDRSIIVMEDLRGIKQKTSKAKVQTKDNKTIEVKRKSHNNRLGQVPFYMLKEILTYKALLCGKKVATVSPCFTSQTNCLTGQRVGVRNGCRFQLGGKTVYDADWNAAINIRNRFLKHPLSTDIVPTDGKLLVHKGRVHSTTRKTEGQGLALPCSLSNPWASCRG